MGKRFAIGSGWCHHETGFGPNVMCLAIPGRIDSLHDNLGVPMARVDFGGITREACLSYVPEAKIGDYVLVHVGFAISRIDEEEAGRTYHYLSELDQLTELEEGREHEVP